MNPWQQEYPIGGCQKEIGKKYGHRGQERGERYYYDTLGKAGLAELRFHAHHQHLINSCYSYEADMVRCNTTPKSVSMASGQTSHEASNGSAFARDYFRFVEARAETVRGHYYQFPTGLLQGCAILDMEGCSWRPLISSLSRLRESLVASAVVVPLKVLEALEAVVQAREWYHHPNAFEPPTVLNLRVAPVHVF